MKSGAVRQGVHQVEEGPAPGLFAAGAHRSTPLGCDGPLTGTAPIPASAAAHTLTTWTRSLHSVASLTRSVVGDQTLGATLHDVAGLTKHAGGGFGSRIGGVRGARVHRRTRRSEPVAAP
jgi:hypothetical protein